MTAVMSPTGNRAPANGCRPPEVSRTPQVYLLPFWGTGQWLAVTITPPAARSSRTDSSKAGVAIKPRLATCSFRPAAAAAASIPLTCAARRAPLVGRGSWPSRTFNSRSGKRANSMSRKAWASTAARNRCAEEMLAAWPYSARTPENERTMRAGAIASRTWLVSSSAGGRNGLCASCSGRSVSGCFIVPRDRPDLPGLLAHWGSCHHTPLRPVGATPTGSRAGDRRLGTTEVDRAQLVDARYNVIPNRAVVGRNGVISGTPMAERADARGAVAGPALRRSRMLP